MKINFELIKPVNLIKSIYEIKIYLFLSWNTFKVHMKNCNIYSVDGLVGVSKFHIALPPPPLFVQNLN